MTQSDQTETPAVATGGLTPAVAAPKDALGNQARLERSGLGGGAEDLSGDESGGHSHDHDHGSASGAGGDDNIQVQRGGGTWTVRRNDNLWNISRATYGSGVHWTAIKRANPSKVSGESTIHVGAVLDLPALDVPAATAPSAEAGVWTVENVTAILNRGSGRTALQKIVTDRINIVRFDTAIQIWEHDDGTLERQDLTGLQSNTVDVRVQTEQFAIDSGMPETRSGYRTADGQVNRQAIRDSVYNSQHYNPTGKHFHSREYVGQITTAGWAVPP